jgi:hypothetical protein
MVHSRAARGGFPSLILARWAAVRAIRVSFNRSVDRFRTTDLRDSPLTA